MAATWIPATSMSWLKFMMKGMSVDNLYPNILQDTANIMWMAAPWRWTLGSLAAVPVTSSIDEIAIGTLPADFMFGYKAWLVSTSTTAQVSRDLAFVGQINPAQSVVGQPVEIQIEGNAGAAGVARFYPAIGSVAANTKLYIIYKKSSPIVDKATQGNPGVLVFPDEYIPTYNAGLLYYGYLFGDDNRAGAATVQGTQVSYSGQLGMFMAMIQFMREREKLPLVEPRPDVKGEK